MNNNTFKLNDRVILITLPLYASSLYYCVGQEFIIKNILNVGKFNPFKFFLTGKNDIYVVKTDIIHA